MLTSPACDANGFSNTFSSQDFASLNTLGAHRTSATEAADWMCAADEFLKAYGSRISDIDSVKAMNRLEVRMTMFIHNKKTETRASFNSLVNIAVEFYKEIKALDPKLPVWSKLPKVTAENKVQPKKLALLRETGNQIGESILAEKGYSLKQLITEGSTGHIYELSSFNADGQSVGLTLVKSADPKKKPTKNLTVARMDLLKGDMWHPVDSQEPKFLQIAKVGDFLTNFDFKTSIIVGEVKAKLAIEFSKSNESDFKIQTFPSVAVVANKKFNKNAMKLVGLVTLSLWCKMARHSYSLEILRRCALEKATKSSLSHQTTPCRARARLTAICVQSIG
jgi:hypothetical protein